MNAIEQWEDAWNEYIDALNAYDKTVRYEFVRGHKRAHRNSRSKLKKAVQKLKKIDPDFYERVTGE